MHLIEGDFGFPAREPQVINKKQQNKMKKWKEKIKKEQENEKEKRKKNEKRRKMKTKKETLKSGYILGPKHNPQISWNVRHN